MNLRALIFDVDGTLADTEEAHRRAFNAAFAEHGLPWNWSRAQYRDLLRVAGGKERIVHYAGTLEAPAAERVRLASLAPAIHRTKTLRYTELVRGGQVRLRPGVRRLIAQARERRIALAIATTTSAENVTSLLEAQFGPRGLALFDCVACGDCVPAKKPAPDIYLRALEALGLRAGQCIAFEDSANGLRAAKAARVFTVVTPSAWTAGEDFSAADLVLDSLADPGADLDSLARCHAAAGTAAAGIPA